MNSCEPGLVWQKCILTFNCNAPFRTFIGWGWGELLNAALIDYNSDTAIKLVPSISKTLGDISCNNKLRLRKSYESLAEPPLTKLFSTSLTKFFYKAQNDSKISHMTSSKLGIIHLFFKGFLSQVSPLISLILWRHMALAIFCMIYSFDS